MEMRSRRISILILSGLLLGPLTAQADESGWYLGLNVGSSHFSSPENFYPVHGGTGAVTSSGDATGKSVFAGYQYTPHFAMEFGYSDLGSASATALEDIGGFDPVTLTPVVVTNFEKINLKAVSADAIFRTSGTGFGVFGKLGLVNTHLYETFSLGGDNSSSQLTYDYGVGLSYSTSTPWVWRLGWSEYARVGGSHSSDLSFVYLGLTYRH